jgi:hypothetical protein
MAVKIFCNCCQGYIKDAKPGEISNLKGTEICANCEGKMVELLNEIEKISKRATHQIAEVAGQAKAQIDEVKRRVIQS